MAYNKYQDGKIYKIVCNETNEVYYGSCITSLNNRLWRHINEEHSRANTITAKQIIHRDNYEMLLIEDYPCNSLNELLQREQYYIENNECINKIKAYQSREEKLEYFKKYNANRKEKQAEYMKEYRNGPKREELLQKKREAGKNAPKIKCVCPHCNKEMLKKSLNRHLKNVHNM